MRRRRRRMRKREAIPTDRSLSCFSAALLIVGLYLCRKVVRIKATDAYVTVILIQRIFFIIQSVSKRRLAGRGTGTGTGTSILLLFLQAVVILRAQIRIEPVHSGLLLPV
jgi:hypothetical protein